MKKISLLIVIVFCNLLLSAQSNRENIEFKISMRDGSVLNGSASIPTVLLLTEYGNLNIPIKNISSIEFGITPDKSIKQKVNSLLIQLNTADKEKNNLAYKELIKLPINAIPLIEEFVTNNEEKPVEGIENTAESVLNEIKAKNNILDVYSDKDIVTIDFDYKMGGVYSLKEISLTTEYGQLTIPKDKIKKVEVTYSSSDNELKTFVLQATKHISSNNNGGWLKTGIMVKSGQKLNITANGEIVLASLSNSKYYPSGKTSSSSSVDVADDPTSSSTSYPSYGNVVYKIGENGTSLRAGDKFSGTTNASGMLYLSIYETVYNAANTGSYNVKVKIK